MTPREQWIKFYQHEYRDGTTMPSIAGFHMVTSDDAGMWDKPPVTMDYGKDWFGCEWVKDTSARQMIPDPRVEFLLEDIADWREVVRFPDLDAYDFVNAYNNSGVGKVDRTQKIIYYPVVACPFERLHILMGFENALIAMVTDPEECEAFFTAFMDWKCKLLEKVKEYFNPDVIMFHDDIGTQNNMFFSPELWRKMLKPHLKRATDKVHELGMFMEYHSCGKLEQVVPDLVEIGVDAWQGQEINDIAALKKLTGDKLGYHPIYDYQKMVAAYAAQKITLDDVRAFVWESTRKGMEGGHYVPLMQPFGDEVTVTMMQEFIKVCMKYGGDPA